MALDDSFMGGEWGARKQAIDRRRKMAEALRKQGQSTQGQMISGHYVPPSWTQYAANMLNAYQASKMDSDADADENKMVAEQSERGKELAHALLDGFKPKEIVQPMDYEEAGSMPGVMQTITQQPNSHDLFNAQAQYYAGIGDMKGLAGLGMERIKFGQQQDARKDLQEFQRQILEDRQQEAAQSRLDQRQSRMEELQLRLQDARTTAQERREFQREMQAQQISARKEIMQLTASNKAGTPYYQPVQTADGVMAFNARSGRLEPAMANGKPVIGAQYDPKLQGQIAGAKQSAEYATKRDFNMGGLGDIIDQARMVLTNTKNVPTHSGLGAAYDKASAYLGHSPSGAEASDKLRALGGALVAKMPRMEGPQSDRDVQNYKEMAGQIGDATLPIERRTAALQQVESLWRKYDKNSAGKGSNLSGWGIERIQ